MAGAELYREGSDAVRRAADELESVEREIGAAFARWEELGEREA
jgi:hypothetical protein